MWACWKFTCANLLPACPLDTLEIMRGIAQHLEQLAPRFGCDLLSQEAVVNWSDLNYPEAERCMLKAIKANPNYELAHTFYSWLLCCFDRPEEAFKQAANLPIARAFQGRHLSLFGNVYYVKRDYTNAIKWYRKTLEWEPHHPASFHGHWQLAAGDGRLHQRLGLSREG